MPHISLSNLLGPHPEALRLRSARAEILAGNLANGDTPGFRARDIDFAATLERAMNGDTNPSQGSMTLAVTRADHLRATDTPQQAFDELLYRTPLMPSIDGNTVDVELERAAMAQNNLQLMAAMQFLNGRIRGLMTAIRGE